MSALLLATLCLLALARQVPTNETATWPVNYYGVDVSQYTSQSVFQCLVGQNLVYAIIRCYQSVGRPDPNCAASVANAHAAGMQVVDAYFFPCPTCGSATTQVNQMLSYFNANSVNVKTMWLDIEGTQYWLGDYGSNQAWYKSLVDACNAAGLVTGVYASHYQWTSIFGDAGFTYGNNLPLWYADYDGEPSFDGFTGFGGWSSPVMKQFSDAGTKCGASYDINWKQSL